MSDELEETTNNDVSDDTTDEEEKEVDDIDPAELPVEDPEELAEEAEVNPEDDPFGLGAFGELDDDGEYVDPSAEDDDETEDEISEDLF